ncbi:kelch-like protein 3 isoform X2 [Vidua macroura]|uniref:kelch-like protein 3 isoform X2 n=1 Tax=Vidua chalybeata TaxID=81927 RepID=UPI0023A7D402|nr:kelch-like protein 3 isoform X2 [Vidua chalybeata]XP_053847481.1 kelch-like protein 3 isoform X2 [Vidua macroura]
MENSQLCKLFIGGLNVQTTEAGLREHFAAYGTLTDCVVVLNPQTKRSRCFGFVTYSAVEEADAAMAASPHAVDGNAVELKRAVSREDSAKPGAHAKVKKLFVGGLKGDVGEGDLVQHFSQFGPVEKAEIIADKQSGKKRGFGFVYFQNHDAADKAAVVKFHPIQGHRVEVKKAVPKEDIQAGGGGGGSSRPSRGGRGGRGRGGGGSGNRDHNGLSKGGGGYNSYGGYGGGGGGGYGSYGSGSYGGGGGGGGGDYGNGVHFCVNERMGKLSPEKHTTKVDIKQSSRSSEAAEDEKDQRTVTVNPSHMRKAFKVMNELRSKRLLCDVVIVAETVEMEAHRVVLAACSPYFCAMFTGDMSESKAKKIEIKDVDGQTLRKLIDYIYTAEIEVTEENVQVLLPAASLLQLMDVRKNCCDFLQSQLHPTNCLGIRAFADVHACTELLQQANAYAEQHFPEVMLGEEFLSLSLDQVCSLISSDKLTVSSEEKVFEAVISWINYEKESRLEHMAKLMEHVRLPLLPRDYLVQTVEEEALIKNNNTCKDFLIEAMKYHLLPLDQRQLIKNPRTKPRTPVSLPKVMIVVGGQAPKAIRSVECYDFEEERWDQVAELPSRRCRAGVVFMAGNVYAVGGFNGSLRVRTVDVYDGVKDQWTSIASMQERRSTLGAAVLNDLLYAVGGFDGSTGLASVEAYSYKTNEWFFVAPMNTRRSSVGVGVVEGVGVLSGLLYATGGHDGPLVRKSVEVYDPGTNTWKQVADMNMCRRNAGVCAVNGLLYVVGGDDGSCNLASVEYYNPSTDKWTLLPTSMSTGRSYAGVAVIHKPL